ncbi:hypothetical protein HPB49_016066 [Dermacentor silvarum]|uniref:Uncharacterized protein n=1 Tax=Dermacentor silvarum TaxID=543639 RepID=A0ACB8D647_DERSI|nr:hypothetical protein HPB49_016066 [Dermacentor silvarum]
MPGSNPLLVAGDFDCAHVDWGYRRTNHRDTVSYNETLVLHMTIFNDFSQPTRIIGTLALQEVMVKAMGIHAIITDRCWTLPPLSALAALLAVLLSKNSAVFYVAFMNEFGVSHESASWPIAVCTVSVQFSGLLVSYLEKRLSIYHITIAGSLLNFVALIAASFAPNITWMSITFGVLSGAGQGIIVVTLSIYAMLYFDKYRAAASGFKYTGISLAPFFSMLLSLSIQQDGLHGASVGLLAMPHATSFSHVIATAVTTGITTGCVTAMKPVLLSDSLGVDNLSFCWGISGVLALPLHLGGPMLIGEYHLTWRTVGVDYLSEATEQSYYIKAS